MESVLGSLHLVEKKLMWLLYWVFFDTVTYIFWSFRIYSDKAKYTIHLSVIRIWGFLVCFWLKYNCYSSDWCKWEGIEIVFAKKIYIQKHYQDSRVKTNQHALELRSLYKKGKYMKIDVSNMYLNTPLNQFEYVR